MGIAIIGKSPSGGNITVGGDWAGNRYNVSTGNQNFWTPGYTDGTPVTGAVADAQSIITALGGEVANTPWHLGWQSATVHPTGGCKMGTSSSSSVVSSHDLHVWGYPGLYVIDGSVIPSSTFRNPSNTILAIAEKTMDVILNVPGAPTW